MTEIDDATGLELWARASRGDAAARESMATLADELVRAELRRRGAPAHEVDDLAQRALHGLLVYLERGGVVQSSLHGFFRNRARGVLSDFRKSRRRSIVEGALDRLRELPATAVPARADSAEVLPAIRECLSRLPKREHRAAFELRYLEGLDSDQAARRAGVPPSTLRVHLFRALRALRTCLEAKGLSVETA